MKGTPPPAGHRSQRQLMLAGEPYRADQELIDAHMRAVRLTEAYNATQPDDPRRRPMLEELLGELGEDSVIRAPFRCDYGSYLRVGARTFINFGLVALDAAPITIGDDVQIGPNVQLLTPTHPTDPVLRRDKWEAAEPIHIGHNAWLGGGVIVLPGVTIDDDTVVGAGAVVTNGLPPGVVAAGNPARIIREGVTKDQKQRRRP